jgi:hypothetical protein
MVNLTEKNIDGVNRPPIPVVDGEGHGTRQILAAARMGVEALLADAERQYGRLGMAALDWRTRRWADRALDAPELEPYRDEILDVARTLGRPGAWLLNLNYEWGCSTAVAADPESNEGLPRLLRTLDWPLDGLGRHLVLARRRGPAGTWLDLTWPGAVGVTTAIAKGRFAAALNQTPLRRHGLGFYGDWLVERIRVGRRRGWPPLLALRHAFERCRDYAEAAAWLARVRLALPVFFTLAGARPGEGCVIERTETEAAIHPAPMVVTNHWLTDGRAGHPRSDCSVERRRHLAYVCGEVRGLDWVGPPILRPETRLACVLVPATGSALVQGFETEGPVTAPTAATA